jgi:glycosyltransferase involved in cell wall biosynthesis
MFRPVSIKLCDPSSIDSFSDAIVDLYRYPQKRAELVANAEQDYVDYRWEVSAERYRQVIASLAHQRMNRRTNWKSLLHVHK